MGVAVSRACLRPSCMPPSEGRQHTATPVVRAVEWAADFVRPLQSGDVNLYLLYVFVPVLAADLIAAL
jgi:hypothetical protein